MEWFLIRKKIVRMMMMMMTMMMIRSVDVRPFYQLEEIGCKGGVRRHTEI
jgi:hypothetical protein